METAIAQFSFLEWLILVLVALLFVREAFVGLVKTLLGVKEPDELIPSWASELQMHYNDETTVLLKEIRDSQREMRDCLKKANTSLDTIKEYGVKIIRA